MLQVMKGDRDDRQRPPVARPGRAARCNARSTRAAHMGALVLGWRLEIVVSRLSLSEFAASLRFGVDLGTEQQGER